MINDILNQSYPDWELLIISNGPNQEEQNKIFKNCEQKDNRIRVFYTDIPGLSNARNIGIEQARGEWITFPDADDRLDPNHLQLFADNCKPDTDVLLGGLKWVYTRKNSSFIKEERFPSGKVITPTNMLCHTMALASAWSKIYKVESIRRTGLKFVVGGEPTEDQTFFYNFILDNPQICSIPMTGYNYFRPSDGTLCTRYCPQREKQDRDLLLLTEKVLLRNGYSPFEIAKYRRRRNLANSLIAVRNQFYPGCPHNFKQRTTELKRIYGNAEWHETIKKERMDGLFMKLHAFLFLNKSATLANIIFSILYNLKRKI